MADLNIPEGALWRVERRGGELFLEPTPTGLEFLNELVRRLNAVEARVAASVAAFDPADSDEKVTINDILTALKNADLMEE